MEEDDQKDFEPRTYQTQLEDIAMKKNTIIHLPTGSGKTYIAIRLINRLSGDLKKPWGQGGKRCFFLVNTVPLVEQQKTVIQFLSTVKSVVGYSGKDRVDYWNKEKWDAELTKYQLIVMTSQILADMLAHSYIRLDQINLLIFDECHHALYDHPMRVVMRHFEDWPPEKQPRVLGLTATLLNSNVKESKLAETLRDLERTFHATIATVDELDEVSLFSTNPLEIMVYYKEQAPSEACLVAIGMLNDLRRKVFSVTLPTVNANTTVALDVGQVNITDDSAKEAVREVKNIVDLMVKFIEEYGAFGGSLAALAYMVLLERLKRKAITSEEERLYKVTMTHAMQVRMMLLDSMKQDSGYAKVVRHSTPKVLQMLDILKEYNPDVYNKPGAVLHVNKSRSDISAIIFTERRFSAKIIFNLLTEVKRVNPEEFGFLKHDFIVGFNVNPFKNTREQYYLKKTSDMALLKFVRKEVNCLISTSVIEEGVDVPQCQLVIRFDPPLHYRSYLQSKGRARSSQSSFVMLIEENNKMAFLKKYENFQKTENCIQQILVGKTANRHAPTPRDIRMNLYNDSEIPAYVTKHGGRLVAPAAISLLNRYCSSLPHDKFTVHSPMYIQETVGFQQVVSVMMPIACPQSQIVKGMPMYNTKNAKRSAALNMCIRLHKAGELDEITLLPRPYGMVNFDELDVRRVLQNWPERDDAADGAPPGSKKRVRTHPKMFPLCLSGPEDPTKEKQVYVLHIIHTTPVFPEPKDPRERALYLLLQKKEGFGFLTLQSLPKICDFPTFLTVGEAKTSIEVNYAVMELDDQLFHLIKRFHYFVFNRVLEVAKPFLAFDGADNCMYCVPTKFDDGYDIDWDVIQEHYYLPPVVEPTYEERKKMRVNEADYKHHVVTPWYRGSIMPDRYIVSNVLEYMTPQSRFEGESDLKFADYYSNKYNLDVAVQEQPLLEVRNISTRMNCLLPRAATIASLTEKQQRQISCVQGDDKPKAFPELFIPEFCIRYDFPGVLWYKATMLPSIVHRVFMLLVAFELRMEITKAVKYGVLTLKNGESWAPLPVCLKTAERALRAQIEDPAPAPTIDRINDPKEEVVDQGPLQTMTENLNQLREKAFAEEYPWKDPEPIDIDRNLTSVTLMDIHCYDKFVSAAMFADLEEPRSPASPAKPAAAIMPPPHVHAEPIRLLSRTPSGPGPELRDILAALTLVGSHDTMNLERQETLGDSFLKFAVSLYLFHTFPEIDEGRLTTIKGRMIGNRNLYYAGVNKQLPGRLKVENFHPRKDFLVPGFFAPQILTDFITNEQIRPTFLVGISFSEPEALSGELSPESMALVSARCAARDADPEPPSAAHASMQPYVRRQAVADKSVADAVEALVGTYLLDGGVEAAARVVEWFRILPPEDKFVSLLSKRVTTILTHFRSTEEEEVEWLMNSTRQEVEEILQYKFNDAALLLEALSHSSFIRNRVTSSYERLEFLGDAVLDFLITSYIFENNPGLSPGELTDLRSSLVNNVTFASYVVRLQLQKFICYQLTPQLGKAIMSFVAHQECRGHVIEEDVLYLIDEEDCYLAEYVEVPKILSDVFESLAGAIFLDSGGSLPTVWRVFYRIMAREIHAFAANIPLQPVRVLYENIHACPRFGAAVKHEVLEKVMVPVSFTVAGRHTRVYGCGNNKAQAKRAAAKMALKILA